MDGPAWLGIAMARSSPGAIGVAVEHVVRRSPADIGGIRAGDRILKLDGVAVSSPADVTRTVHQRHAGDRMTVGVSRAGAPRTFALVLAARPSTDELLKMDLVGTFAPAWQDATPLAGAPASLAQLRGRVVLMDFWASWCGPCAALTPRLSALRDRYGAQGLTVVGITTDDRDKAALYAERHQMRYGVVVDDQASTSKAYGITSLPTMVLIDKRGVVRDVFVGFDPSGGNLESRIKALLAEPGGP